MFAQFGSEVKLSSNAWFLAAQAAYAVDLNLALTYLNQAIEKRPDSPWNLMRWEEESIALPFEIEREG